MVQNFGGRARFVSENYGESELARRYGVTRYPAIFVDDVLVATPKDFGFFGRGEGANQGRYAPLRTVESHARFRADLTRMIEQLLAGRRDLATAAAATVDGDEVATLPGFALATLDGDTLRSTDLAGRVVVAEFWATWCPPCRPTLRWLGELKRRHGDSLEVLALAVESDSAAVAKLAAQLGLPLRWAIATPEVARAFGDVSAVPTLHVFGADGRRAGVYYGAPPGLHAEAERRIAEAVAAVRPPARPAR